MVDRLGVQRADAGRCRRRSSAVCGSSSLTHVPHLAVLGELERRGPNRKARLLRGHRRSAVVLADGVGKFFAVPLRTSGLGSNRSSCDGPPALRARRLRRPARGPARPARAVEDRLASAGSTCATATGTTSAGIGLSDDEQTRCWSTGGRPRPRAFYRATAAAPGGVVRRRHIATRGRARDRRRRRGAGPRRHGRSASTPPLTGEGALLAARRARTAPAGWATSSPPSRPSRTGSSAPTWPACSSSRAGRAPARRPSRCTAPPTCSTPTASGSRAAACSSSGPNPVFLRYIEQVLPSLGETGVVLATRRPSCTPGVEPAGDERRADVAALKGDLRMARRRSRARCADRQRVPDGASRCWRSTATRVTLTPARRRRGPGPGPPHPPAAQRGARGASCSDLLDDLAGQLAGALGTDADRRRPRRTCSTTCATARDVRRELNLCLDAADAAAVAAPTCSPPRPGWRPPRRTCPPPSAACCCATAARPGRSPTSRCSTRRPSCSATSRTASDRRREAAGAARARRGRRLRAGGAWR